jgi:hypothetical protein
MKKKYFPLLILGLSLFCSLALAGTHRVQLKILDHGKAVPGTEVRITYPSATSTIGTTVVVRSDRWGRVELEVPATIFWVTVPEINPEVVGREFRIPEQAAATVRWNLRPRDWRKEGEKP